MFTERFAKGRIHRLQFTPDGGSLIVEDAGSRQVDFTESVRWWSLAGVGTHCVDLVRWIARPIAGEGVELRSLLTRGVHKGPHDETAILAMRFASGATAEVVASVLFDSTSTVEVFGSTASAVCDGTLGPHGAGSIRVGGAELAFLPVDPYAGELADFAEAVRTGRSPEVDGTEGLHNVEILCEAAP